ncbi:MAG: hypothetical protein JW940_29840 [Polyangiaceae bacterium]|nr:hypothetical protein [Polyangiaceae bacterium]
MATKKQDTPTSGGRKHGNDRIGPLLDQVRQAYFGAKLEYLKAKPDDAARLEVAALGVAAAALHKAQTVRGLSEEQTGPIAKRLQQALTLLERDGGTRETDQRYAAIARIHTFMSNSWPEPSPGNPLRTKRSSALVVEVLAALTFASPVGEAAGFVSGGNEAAERVIATWRKPGQWVAINALLALWGLHLPDDAGNKRRRYGATHRLANWYSTARKRRAG